VSAELRAIAKVRSVCTHTVFTLVSKSVPSATLSG
jgi:hypothetical protein